MIATLILLATAVVGVPVFMTTSPAASILQQTITALGEGILHVNGLVLSAPNLFRSHTLTQSYELNIADQPVSSAGSQNISFSFQNGTIFQRIDRTYNYDYYWRWAHPSLKPALTFSLVVHDGLDGFSCFNNGSNSFFMDDNSVAQGYGDGYLTDYLITSARQTALPWIIQTFWNDSRHLQMSHVVDESTQASYIAFEHPNGLNLLVNPETHLPEIVRTYEDHKIYGTNSTNDLVLSQWTTSSGILMPTRYQTVYNGQHVLEDYVIESLAINPSFEQSFFDPIPPAASNENPQDPAMSTPKRSREYPRSEVHEMYETALWSGPFADYYNITDVNITEPVADSESIKAIYVGYPDYVQLLVEFEDGLLITDCPAHRSNIILEWVKQQGKHIKYVVPTHHHRDHAGGLADYMNAGATLVVPSTAKDFYVQNSHGWKIETYNSSWSKNDSKVQFHTFSFEEARHAADWTMAVAAPVNPKEGQFVLYEADVINPGTEADKLRWDIGEARAVFSRAIQIGLPATSIMVGSHGSTHNQTSTTDTLKNVAKIAGFPYPNLKVGDWKASH